MIQNDGIFLNKKDFGKYKPSFIPPYAIEIASRVFEFGSIKGYKYFSFRNVPDAIKRYLDALERHLNEVKQYYVDTGHYGKIEQESGIIELAFLLSNAMMIIDCYIIEESKKTHVTPREFIDDYMNVIMFEEFGKFKKGHDNVEKH